MIQVSNLTKSFNGFQAVKGISFSVGAGEKLILLGTSGSGKTTTLKMINGIISKDHGQILVNGKDIDKLDHHELRRGIGYVIQNVGLFPHYSIAQNVAIVPQILGWDKEKINAKVDELLSMVGLDNELKTRKPKELSGGQQQRVGLARALAADPELVLLDEPFGALDPITRNEIQREFLSLESVVKKTMIMVTHDVKEACILGDRICLMDQGEIQQIGTPKELIFFPSNDFVKSFIGANAYELELLVIRLQDLVDFLTKGEYSEEHTSFLHNVSIQSVIEEGVTGTCSFKFENDYYSFRTEELLGHYFSNRESIISRLK